MSVVAYSAILITAGATLSNTPSASSADLFSIYALLRTSLSKAAATIFALALLLSGQTAGLVVTLAGQIVSEGHINIAIAPWKRRLVTRGIAVIPAIVVAGAVGREGLGGVLNASQVALSVILPVVSAPLIWFTSRRVVMSVPDESLASDYSEGRLAAADSPMSMGNEGSGGRVRGEGRMTMVDLSNSWSVSVFGGVVWLFITGLNMVSQLFCFLICLCSS